MTVKVFSGVKLSPTHTYNHVTLFDFICDGKIMRIMKNDQATFLPAEAIREIICEMEEETGDLATKRLHVVENGVQEDELIYYYSKNKEN